MREGVGKALRRAFGQEDLIGKLEPRKAGVSRLMNPKRRSVFVHLLKHPSSHLRQLSRALGIPVQTLKWHLAELEEAGILASVPVGNRRCYFVPARIEREDIPVLSSLSEEVNRRILSLLMKRGPLSQKDIFSSLGTYRQAVQPRLKALETAGVIRSSKRGRERTYEITDGLMELRDRYVERKGEVSKSLCKILDDDGLSPKVSKTLSRSAIYTIDTGEGRAEIQAYFDPLTILKE
ncbi:MAG: winged helix-turn-helix transcriptional regulator [Thermoplasmata archaeon]